MSLINQMLKDIDQRQAQGTPLTALPGELGRAPESKPKTRLSVIALAVVAGLLGAAALSVDSLKARFGQVASVPAPAAPVPPLSVVSPSTPVDASLPVVTPAPLPMEQVPQPSAVQGVADALKEADPAAVKSALSQVAKLAQTASQASTQSPPPAKPPPTAEASTEAVVKAPNKAEPAPRGVSSQPGKAAASPPAAASSVVTSSVSPAAPTSPSPQASVKPATPVSPDVPPPAKGEVSRALSAQQRAANGYADALTFINQGQVDAAAHALQANLALDDAHHPSRLLLARLWTDTGRTDEAKALLTLTLAKPSSVGSVGAAYAMALVHTTLKQGQLNDALAVLEQHAALAADNAEYHALWAALLQRKGAHDESVSHYLQALRKQPDVAHWLVGLGLSLQAKQMNEAAVQSFQRALSLGLPPNLADVAQARLQALGK